MIIKALSFKSMPVLLLSLFTAWTVVAQPSPQGDNWDSIKQLPGWSGTWALDKGWIASYDAYKTDLNLTTEYEKIRQQAYEEKHQANLSSCLPAGPSAVMQHAILHEYLFTPGRVTLIFEDGTLRTIHTDGRAHRDLSELNESFMGDSIGHWEDGTLVVDTIGFPNGELWQNYGVKARLNTHLSERIFLNDEGSLQIDSVMTDPVIFVTPYTFSRTYSRSPLSMHEPGCLQYNRDDGSDIDLTPPE